ncbi:MAG TPA: VIT1/CCC1 transporter family protein [Chloroflexia bacterium]|nr:VIT1/CCC1 transporter family protein [Chloroflexia bacterium]
MTTRPPEQDTLSPPVRLEPHVEQHPHGGDWLREIVFGLNDGLVTTLVFLMAVSELAPTRLVLIMLGEVGAGGISMALGGYLSARTAQEVLARRIATERFEIQHEPEEERAELRAIYARKGLTGPLLDHVVTYLTADEDRWHRALVADELGVVDEQPSRPWRQGLLIGLAFIIGGLIPTVPVLLAFPAVRWWAYGLTAGTALTLGAIKARYTHKGPWRSGLEFLGVVTVGTLAGIGIGWLLHGG